MAYRFAGFFAKGRFDPPASLPNDAVWRTISAPFVGVGVRLPSLIGESPDPRQVGRLRQQVGLHAVDTWLYLTYDCWAGRIDYVYGLGMSAGRAFGPFDESDISKVREVFLALMDEFGLAPTDALAFAPFRRGFWGEE